MFRRPASPLRVPLLDLDTVRDTLRYMHDDLKRAPGLDDAAKKLGEAIVALENADKARQSLPANILSARFLRRPRH